MDTYDVKAFNPDDLRRKPESIQNQLINLRVFASQDDYRKKVGSLLQRLDPAIEVAQGNSQLDPRQKSRIMRVRKRIGRLLNEPSLDHDTLYQNLAVIYDILSGSGRVAIEDLCKDPKTEDKKLALYTEEES